MREVTICQIAEFSKYDVENANASYHTANLFVEALLVFHNISQRHNNCDTFKCKGRVWDGIDCVFGYVSAHRRGVNGKAWVRAELVSCIAERY